MAQNGEEERYFEIHGKKCRVLEEVDYCLGFSYIILEGFKERYEQGISCPGVYYPGVEIEYPEAVGAFGRIHLRMPPQKLTLEYLRSIGLGHTPEAETALSQRLPLRDMCSGLP